MKMFDKLFIFGLQITFLSQISHFLVDCRISNERRCVNVDCSVPISYARTMVTYYGNEEGLISFKKDTKAIIYSKEAGDNLDYWEAEIDGKRGYVPKGLLIEEKILVKDESDVRVIVPTKRIDQKPSYNISESVIAEERNSESVLSETPSLPAANTKGIFNMFGEVSADSVPTSKPDIKPQTAKKYEVVDGTTLYEDEAINSIESKSPISHPESSQQKNILVSENIEDSKEVNSKAKHVLELLSESSKIMQENLKEDIKTDENQKNNLTDKSHMDTIYKYATNLISSGSGEADVEEGEEEEEEVEYEDGSADYKTDDGPSDADGVYEKVEKPTLSEQISDTSVNSNIFKNTSKILNDNFTELPSSMVVDNLYNETSQAIINNKSTNSEQENTIQNTEKLSGDILAMKNSVKPNKKRTIDAREIKSNHAHADESSNNDRLSPNDPPKLNDEQSVSLGGDVTMALTNTLSKQDNLEGNDEGIVNSEKVGTLTVELPNIDDTLSQVINLEVNDDESLSSEKLIQLPNDDICLEENNNLSVTSEQLGTGANKFLNLDTFSRNNDLKVNKTEDFTSEYLGTIIADIPDDYNLNQNSNLNDDKDDSDFSEELGTGTAVLPNDDSEAKLFDAESVQINEFNTLDSKKNKNSIVNTDFQKNNMPQTTVDKKDLLSKNGIPDVFEESVKTVNEKEEEKEVTEFIDDVATPQTTIKTLTSEALKGTVKPEDNTPKEYSSLEEMQEGEIFSSKIDSLNYQETISDSEVSKEVKNDNNSYDEKPVHKEEYSSLPSKVSKIDSHLTFESGGSEHLSTEKRVVGDVTQETDNIVVYHDSTNSPQVTSLQQSKDLTKPSSEDNSIHFPVKEEVDDLNLANSMPDIIDEFIKAEEDEIEAKLRKSASDGFFSWFIQVFNLFKGKNENIETNSVPNDDKIDIHESKKLYHPEIESASENNLEGMNNIDTGSEKIDISRIETIQVQGLESCTVETFGEGDCKSYENDPVTKNVHWEQSSQSVELAVGFIDNLPVDITIWLLVTALAVLIFSLGHYYIEAHRRDGPLVAVINKLEREVLVLKKENCILEDNLHSLQDQLEEWNTTSTEKDGLIVDLKQELTDTKSAKLELDEQVAVLEREVESVTEHGLEIHRMLEESLSSQDGSQVLLSTVETLREKLDQQENVIAALSKSLARKTVEVEELERKLNQSVEVATGLEEKVIIISREKDEEALLLKEQCRELVSHLEQVMENKALEETRFSTKLSKLQLAIEELQKTVAQKDTEVEELYEVIKQLRSTDNNDKLEALFDTVTVRAQLRTVTIERDQLSERFHEEEGARKLLEGHMKKITQEVLEMKNSFETAEKEKIEALTKLQVLSNYFKEKESQLQKELGLQESMWLQKQSDDHTIYEQMRSLREENEKYKLQNESLKKEIVDQESSFKIQIANIEQKCHENWVTSRQAERRLKEVQQEAAQLRNRLTAEKNSATNFTIEESKPTSEMNGDSTSPPPPLMFPPASSPPFMMYPMPPPGDYVPPPPLLTSPFPSDSRPPPLGRISSPPLDPRFSPPPPIPYTSYDYPPYRHHSPSPPPPLHQRSSVPMSQPRDHKDRGISSYSPDTVRKNKR